LKLQAPPKKRKKKKEKKHFMGAARHHPCLQRIRSENTAYHIFTFDPAYSAKMADIQ